MQDFANEIINYAEIMGVQYCDVRAEQYTKNTAHVENSNVEYIRTTHDKGMGIRILYDGVWGFCSTSDPKSFRDIQMQVENAIKYAKYQNKKETKLSFIPQSKARQKFSVYKKPEIHEMIEIAKDCDSIIRERENVVKSSIIPTCIENSKYFVNSEGSSILQEFTDCIIQMTATARDSNTQSVNVTEGGRGGIEKISNAYESAKNIAEKSSQLLHAKSVSEEKTTLIMNPDFVALLVHEILGHPSEADRVLGREMAWAGGAWWSDKLGEKIGSAHLNVFDDPTIDSLGRYNFDDEGVKTKRTTLVKDGILENHMQNRETAQMFDSESTGNMRASHYSFMPLIRMACTCIEGGDYNPEEMIKEVNDGYLISNMKVPSIDMMRYNWSISCQYAHKIRNGKIAELCKDVIVTGTSPEFFKSIDACGNDFAIRPITNCGKGDPMQIMSMGNGGPSIRGVATVKSVK